MFETGVEKRHQTNSTSYRPTYVLFYAGDFKFIRHQVKEIQ
jgi:hypothetical protein